MEQQRYDDLEIDRCTSCGGIFLDKGELEQVDSRNLGPIIDLAANAADAERMNRQPAHCHRCDHAMLALQGAGDIAFDWCEQCEGMFFDSGELAAMDVFEA
jgi:Zn-finger nucleic acid-binding protein